MNCNNCLSQDTRRVISMGIIGIDALSFANSTKSVRLLYIECYLRVSAGSPIADHDKEVHDIDDAVEV